MRRRLFEGFEQGVKRVFRQHVYLINQIHFITPSRGHVDRVFNQLTHVIHTRVTRRVDFKHVNKPPRVNVCAGLASIARRGSDAGFAV